MLPPNHPEPAVWKEQGRTCGDAILSSSQQMQLDTAVGTVFTIVSAICWHRTLSSGRICPRDKFSSKQSFSIAIRSLRTTSLALRDMTEASSGRRYFRGGTSNQNVPGGPNGAWSTSQASLCGLFVRPSGRIWGADEVWDTIFAVVGTTRVFSGVAGPVVFPQGPQRYATVGYAGGRCDAPPQ